MFRLKRRKQILAGFAALVCVLLTWATLHYVDTRKAAVAEEHFGSGKPLDPEKLAPYSAEELIERLQDVAAQGLGTHATAWADGFLASDEEPQFRGGILGSAKPQVSPVMRELVRRGLAAMPNLLDHLNDPRPSCLLITNLTSCGMWHSDEYDCRYDDPDKQPDDVNTRREADVVSGYRIRVGDLCFVVIGQIVNRRLNAVRYQPSGCLVINSPVESPPLAAAVRKDWVALTAEQHEQSLIEDAKASFQWISASALVRLRFYYPEAASRITAKE
jgi:hypothetical protein